MALYDTTWYISSVGWTAVTAWATGTVTAAGTMVRQLAAPAVGSERVFICIIAGTTHATTEPTWVLTRGAKTTDNTVTWQECSGASAVNGDVTNTPTWTSVKNTAITLGAIIKRDSAASYQICSTAGTAGNGSEPAFSNTAGTTTADNTVTWTSLGVVGNFTGGQAPHARLTNALTSTWGALNNTIFVKSDHAETRAAAMTILGVNSVTNPQYVLCHDGAAYPPLAANLTTGGTLTTTAGNAISFDATAMYFEGLIFQCGSGGVNTSLALGNTTGWQVFKNCSLQKLGTTATAAAITAVSDCYIELNNTTVKFGATGDSLRSRRSRIIWRDTGDIIASGSSVPTTLFTSLDTGFVYVRNCDLSTIAGTLVGATEGNFVFEDCKLHASVTHTSAPGGPNTQNVDVIRCASGATNYNVFRYRYEGTESTEITIFRTGGASDGTQAQARKIVSTSGAKALMPFDAFPIAIWNDSTSSLTLTLYGIWGGGAVPDNDDFWIEVEYLGSSGSPVGTMISSGKATALTTATALSTDGVSTWGGSTTPFKTSVTFTPAMKGPIICRVRVGTASTFYYDPKVDLA